MTNPSVTHSTFVIERSYPQPPATVFTFFADPVKKRHWFVDGEHKEIDAFELDFRIGGNELVRYHYVAGSPYPDAAFTNAGSFQDIVPNQRIVNASTMTMGEMRFSASLVTFEFLQEESGTKLVFTFQGAFFEGADGPQIREMGWRKLLDRLAAALSTVSK